MKHYILSTLLLAGLAGAARAQTAPLTPPVATSQGRAIIVTIGATRQGIRATFDTAGAGIDGLTEAELTKRFAQASSAAAVVRFMEQRGYHVTGFTTTQASTHGGTGDTGGGTNGYVILFE